MSNLTYAQALSIAQSLVDKQTKAAKLLTETCERYRRAPTFVILRAGDPHNWTDIPRIELRGRPSREMVKAGFTNTGRRRLEGPYTMRHIDTGKTITGLTIRDLVERAGLEDTLANQRMLGHMVSGERTTAGGWCMTNHLETPITLQDIYGNQYPTMTIEEYAKRFGRSVSSALRLLSGRKRFEGNLALASTSINPIMRPRKRRLTSISIRRDGVTVTASSIPKLARLVHMDQQQLYRMAYGFKDQTNGFEIKEAVIENRAVLVETPA